MVIGRFFFVRVVVGIWDDFWYVLFVVDLIWLMGRDVEYIGWLVRRLWMMGFCYFCVLILFVIVFLVFFLILYVWFDCRFVVLIGLVMIVEVVEGRIVSMFLMSFRFLMCEVFGLFEILGIGFLLFCGFVVFRVVLMLLNCFLRLINICVLLFRFLVGILLKGLMMIILFIIVVWVWFWLVLIWSLVKYFVKVKIILFVLVVVCFRVFLIIVWEGIIRIWLCLSGVVNVFLKLMESLVWLRDEVFGGVVFCF